MEMKEKRRHRFNFVDAIIIVVALLLVAAIAFIFVFDGAVLLSKIFDKGEDVTIYYAVELTRVRDNLVDGNIAYIPENAEVIDEVKNYNIGSYVGYLRDGSEVIGTMKNGHTIVSTYPGYSSVILVVKAEAKRDKYQYMIDGYELQVGHKVDLSVMNFAGSGYCIALDEIDSEADKSAFMEYVDDLYSERVFVNDENKHQVEGIAPKPTEPTTDNTDNKPTEEPTETTDENAEGGN